MRALVLLTAASAFAASLSSPAAADVHVDELHGFSIDVPEGWTLHEQEMGDRFVLQVLPEGSIGHEGVTVTVLAAKPETTLESALALALDSVTEQAADVSEWQGTVGDREAPGVRLNYSAPSGEYRLVQSFLLERQRIYMLQRHAPVEAYDAEAERLEAVVQTFDFVEMSDEASEEALLIELANRCGSEVDWAEDWDAAAERARAEKKPVLVAMFLLSGFALSDTPLNSTFVDRDVIELVNERFVPLWFEKADAAAGPAFVEKYGLGDYAFGQALLVVTPDGELIHETHAASMTDVALPFLRAALELAPELSGTAVDPELEPLARARRHAARGEHAVARALLKGDESADAALLRAKLLRRERRGAEALTALRQARAAGAEASPELDVREAGLLIRGGERAAGLALLDRVITEHAQTEVGREARLSRAYLDLPAGRDEARRRWRALALEAPDSRWAWQAAAALRSTILDIDIEPDPSWPREDSLGEMLLPNRPTPLPLERAEDAAAAAAAWLIERQNEDGSWTGPNQTSEPAGMGPNPFRDATAAIAGSALLRRTDDEAAKRAAQRTLAFLLESVARREEEPPLVLFMDYMTWSDAMILRFIADALDRGVGNLDGLASTVNVLVADMEARQRDGGGWSYYVTSDVEGDGAPSNSISFTTAAAVLALARAREVGFRIPDEVLDPAIDALARMRLEDGTFSYFLFHATGKPEPSTPIEGAVGRGPACELALHSVGRSDDARLGAQVERFLRYRHLFSAEQGKAVMHAGPHGQGCHYLLFDYAHAALARAEVGPDEAFRGERAKIMELVLACRQPDGSFLDTPLLGRAYGTAMGLLALESLGE